MIKHNPLNTVSTLPKGEVLTHPHLFDVNGVIQPMPAYFWETTSREDKMRFGHHHGLYSFPTVELVTEINKIIDGREALEIGAGNGGLAHALGIRATDNYQQAMPKYAELYKTMGQPTVKYGPHVENMEAIKAVCTYNPEVVVASWVTHKYDERRHNLGGNIIGVDEHVLLGMVDDYIFIGNTNVHNTKPLFIDLQAGRIPSHTVKTFIVDDRMIASRASAGFDFMIHLGRV